MPTPGTTKKQRLENRKVHYHDEAHEKMYQNLYKLRKPIGRSFTLCGYFRHKVTKDKDKVTCESCIQKLGLS